MSLLLAVLWLAFPALGQDRYGAKGIFPVYEGDGKWWIYEKGGRQEALKPGARFLVVGSRGSGLFSVARSSAAFGGLCRARQPVKLRTAILAGDRKPVGSPIIGIAVTPAFTLKGSKARYTPLSNQVTEQTYARLLAPLKSAVSDEIKRGVFRFKVDDNPSPRLLADPLPEQLTLKIDFGSEVGVRGLSAPFVLVAGAQASATYRRCLRLADGERLLGDCLEMPDALMAETSRLQFVAYDPSGKGGVLVLAYTPAEPLWGHERWGFALTSAGPRLFLMDSMDPRCREGF